MASSMDIVSELGYRVECEGGVLEYDGGGGCGLDDEGGVRGVGLEGQFGRRLHTWISDSNLG